MTAHFPSPMQRSHGEAFASFRAVGGRLRLGDLRQQGSAKLLLPHVGAVPEVVFLNTSGGITGGDRLRYGLDLGAGVRAVATTQTAERAYRASAGVGRVEAVLVVAAGGWLDWLPQETILFQGSALRRETTIDLAGDAGCLALESVVLGRAAMGETITDLAFDDRRTIRRDGRVLLIEPLSLRADAIAGGVAVLGGARAFASLVLVQNGAEDALGPVRQVLDQAGVQAAASGWDGKLVVRMLATDGWPLRQQILRVLGVLRQSRPLPRVWQI